MLHFLYQTKRVLWAFVELAFVTVLAIILVYLILGQNSGPFVQSVADNVLKFAAAMPTPSLVGLAIVAALIYLIAQRMR